MPGAIQSIERAAAIMALVAQAPFGIGVSEVAGALGLPKATAHGLLRTLHGVGYVRQDARTGKYRMGEGPSGAGMDTNVLRSYAMNWADTVAARTGESVRMGAVHADGVQIVHHVFRPDRSVQRLRVGVVLPLHATALGKVLLAYTPGLAERGGELPAYTHRTITAPRALHAQLTQVRAHGFATDIGEFAAERASVAAPVRDPGGRVVGAIGVVGAVDRVCGAAAARAGLVESVRSAAAAISTDIAADRARVRR
ncbi:IclR family transcriptional regulator [Nocardia cyriacigeorgica]|uniref:IclR family transcriptional regulator n=1 Tax=Nocardia cyriacigeorgica TaxID=135487 RepID=UPI001895FF74|nr:IclR family transcriptional regulator [Nocardia cyriacigeorgica]MBF6413928.1 IclR family transcriptional regulator [Nocardia cyriacigeorgica]